MREPDDPRGEFEGLAEAERRFQLGRRTSWRQQVWGLVAIVVLYELALPLLIWGLLGRPPRTATIGFEAVPVVTLVPLLLALRRGPEWLQPPPNSGLIGWRRLRRAVSMALARRAISDPNEAAAVQELAERARQSRWLVVASFGIGILLGPLPGALDGWPLFHFHSTTAMRIFSGVVVAVVSLALWRQFRLSWLGRGDRGSG